jgi:hypothetical protein
MWLHTKLVSYIDPGLATVTEANQALIAIRLCNDGKNSSRGCTDLALCEIKIGGGIACQRLVFVAKPKLVLLVDRHFQLNTCLILEYAVGTMYFWVQNVVVFGMGANLINLISTPGTAFHHQEAVLDSDYSSEQVLPPKASMFLNNNYKLKDGAYL